MIDLEALSIRVDFRHLEFSGTLREDGYYVDKTEEGKIDDLHLKMDNFVVMIHSMEFLKNENAWDTYLLILKEFFTTVDPEMLRPLCTPGVLCFHLGKYYERPHQSEQDDMFIANYMGWPYVQFDHDFQFNTLFSIDNFKKILNNKHHTYQVHDRGWPETKMFMQKMTPWYLTEAFQRLIKLNRMEEDTYRMMSKVRDAFYEINEETWIQNLE